VALTGGETALAATEIDCACRLQAALDEKQARLWIAEVIVRHHIATRGLAAAMRTLAELQAAAEEATDRRALARAAAYRALLASLSEEAPEEILRLADEAAERLSAFAPRERVSHALVEAARHHAGAGSAPADAPEAASVLLQGMPAPSGSAASAAFVSSALRSVARLADAAGASRLPVMLRGDVGLHPDRWIARLHADRPGPAITLDCSGVTDEVTPERLTDAFEQAGGGTLVLHEVGGLPAETQPTLLRLIRKALVSSDSARPVSTTTRALERRVGDGSFSADLFSALTPVTLDIPPVRETPEDIPALAREHLARLSGPSAPTPALTPAADAALQQYGWPGSERQLLNVLEAAFGQVRSEPRPVIDSLHLGLDGAATGTVGLQQDPTVRMERGDTLDDALARAERHLIELSLVEHAGQVTATAQALGLTRQGLYKKMKRLGIDPARVWSDDASGERKAEMTEAM
jgi:transcriptional regulator of acetoin/glycerol metabolism